MKRLIGYIKKEMEVAAVLALIGIVVMCVLEVMTAKNTAITHNIELWIEASAFLDFFFPLFVSLPFAWRVYCERKDGFINYVAIRTDRRKYLISKIGSGLVTVFVMVFIIYYVGLVFAQICIEPECIAEDVILGRYIWGQMQMNMPLVFGIFWCVWKGVVGMAICLFGYAVALVADNIFVISLLPFLYCVLENFVTGTLGLERYSIYTSFILDRLSPDAMQVHNYYAGVVIFAVMTGVITVVWIMRKRQVDYREEHN